MGCIAVRLTAATAAQPNATVSSRIHLLRAVFGPTTDHSSEVLSELFDHGLEMLHQGLVNEALTAAACAVLFLSQQSKPYLLVLRQYVHQLFLPLATAAEGTCSSDELLHEMALLLAAGNAWELVLEVMTCASCSLQTSIVGISSQVQKTNHISVSVLTELSPVTSCLAVQHLAAVTLSYQQQRLFGTGDSSITSSSSSSAVQQVLDLASGPLFDSACSLLCATDVSLRRANLQVLLPVLVSAAQAAGSAVQQSCMQQLWQQCLAMIAQPAGHRRAGLTVLLQYWSAWALQAPDPTEQAAPAATASVHGQSPVVAERVAAAQEAAAAQGDQECFLALLRECLADPEPLNRKRALRLLQLLLPPTMLQDQPVWGVFLTLYELLDEFAPHLLKSAWPSVSRLLLCWSQQHACQSSRAGS
jgi:hypothetical protein